MQNFYVTDDI